MLIRATVILLLIGNLAYVGWREYHRTGEFEPVAIDPLAGTPELVLLREREDAMLAGEMVPSREDLALASNCFALGPFSNEADLRRAFNALAPYVASSRERQTVETQDRGFWVYLPAVDTREEALRLARELSAAGLRDYYVVTAGAQENTISLGLFRLEDNARRRLEALRTLGFEATMARRTEESRAYWLDYAATADAQPPWERVVASSPGVARRPIPCFRNDGV